MMARTGLHLFMNGITVIAVLEVVVLDEVLPVHFLVIGQVAGALTQRTGVLHGIEDGLTNKLAAIGQMREGGGQITVHLEGDRFLFV